MSHAHGWATGPAAALSQRVLGLRPLGVSADGPGDFAVEPTAVSGLTFCNGSASFGGGRVELSWAAGGGSSFRLDLDASGAPPGAVARIGLPIPPALDETALTLRADGAEIWRAASGPVAAAAASASGVDAGAARVARGRLWLELAEARALRLELQ